MSERWGHIPSVFWNKYPPPEEAARREREIEMRRQIEAEKRQKRKAWIFETFLFAPIRFVRKSIRIIEERTRPKTRSWRSRAAASSTFS